jgi:hypothetical protein
MAWRTNLWLCDGAPLRQVANYVVPKVEITKPWLVEGVLLALLALNYFIPIGTIAFESRVLESLFYAHVQPDPVRRSAVRLSDLLAQFFADFHKNPCDLVRPLSIPANPPIWLERGIFHQLGVASSKQQVGEIGVLGELREGRPVS